MIISSSRRHAQETVSAGHACCNRYHVHFIHCMYCTLAILCSCKASRHACSGGRACNAMLTMCHSGQYSQRPSMLPPSPMTQWTMPHSSTVLFCTGSIACQRFHLSKFSDSARNIYLVPSGLWPCQTQLCKHSAAWKECCKSFAFIAGVAFTRQAGQISLARLGTDAAFVCLFCFITWLARNHQIGGRSQRLDCSAHTAVAQHMSIRGKRYSNAASSASTAVRCNPMMRTAIVQHLDPGTSNEARRGW